MHFIVVQRVFFQPTYHSYISATRMKIFFTFIPFARVYVQTISFNSCEGMTVFLIEVTPNLLLLAELVNDAYPHPINCDLEH